MPEVRQVKECVAIPGRLEQAASIIIMPDLGPLMHSIEKTN
jgi:hypothetical protein